MNLGERLRGRVTVVGIGNPLRGDDGVGCRVAELLIEGRRTGARALRNGVAVLNVEDVLENYLGDVAAAHPDVVLMVDAADVGGAPGDAALVEESALKDAPCATHRTPLGVTASVIRQRTGAEVLVLTVQPASLDWGAPMSAPVAEAAEHVSALLQEALGC